MLIVVGRLSPPELSDWNWKLVWDYHQIIIVSAHALSFHSICRELCVCVCVCDYTRSGGDLNCARMNMWVKWKECSITPCSITKLLNSVGCSFSNFPSFASFSLQRWIVQHFLLMEKLAARDHLNWIYIWDQYKNKRREKKRARVKKLKHKKPVSLHTPSDHIDRARAHRAHTSAMSRFCIYKL